MNTRERTQTNKYHAVLERILTEGKVQRNRKGYIRYLLNERLELSPADLLDIFEGHGIARRKLRDELQLFMRGERDVAAYRNAGITWWNYCGSRLVNSYPTYLEKLPPLVARINRERRNSKNYVLFLGATDAERQPTTSRVHVSLAHDAEARRRCASISLRANQAPCLSLVQFQIEDGQLVVSAYQRSSDTNRRCEREQRPLADYAEPRGGARASLCE